MKKFVLLKERITKRDTSSIKKYFDELNKIPLLTPEEEYDLSILNQKGDIRARNKLVKHNLRFVISVAKQYDVSNVRFEDLLNEGNMGLMKATESFDPSKGFKFISYSVWFVRQRLLRFISQSSKTIRVPENKNAHFYSITKRINLLEQKLERKPDYNEIVSELRDDFSEASIDFSINKTSTESLDKAFGDNSGSLLDLISDLDSNDPSSVLDSKSSTQNTNLLLHKLNEQQSLVIQMLFGLNSYEAKTPLEIARELNISVTLISQIKSKSLKKLKDILQGNASWMVED
jgi:RNA polymerase primary sigma factor